MERRGTEPEEEHLSSPTGDASLFPRPEEM